MSDSLGGVPDQAVLSVSGSAGGHHRVAPLTLSIPFPFPSHTDSLNFVSSCEIFCAILLCDSSKSRPCGFQYLLSSDGIESHPLRNLPILLQGRSARTMGPLWRQREVDRAGFVLGAQQRGNRLSAIEVRSLSPLQRLIASQTAKK